MAKTYLDQIVSYPAEIINKISNNDICVALLMNKSIVSVTEDDYDEVLEKYISDYEYIDGTINQSCAYIWVEVEINRIDNNSCKDIKIYITVACHKDFMKLDRSVFPSIIGNRRDNLTRYIDKILNNQKILGIGNLKLDSIRNLKSYNNFTFRELSYSVPDFNYLGVNLV